MRSLLSLIEKPPVVNNYLIAYSLVSEASLSTNVRAELVTINQLQISKNLCIIILLLAELGTGVDTCGARQRRKRILGEKKKPSNWPLTLSNQVWWD